MIDHTGINVTNLALSKNFYEIVLTSIGYVIRAQTGNSVGFGPEHIKINEDPGGDFWISEGNPFNPRNHIAFRAENEKEVKKFYDIAIRNGAKDNGQPGLRPNYHANYYAAFVIDPDGYNIEVVTHKS